MLTILTILKKLRGKVKTTTDKPLLTPYLVGKEGYIIVNSNSFYGLNAFDYRKEFPLEPWFIHPLKQVGPKKWVRDTDEVIEHKSKAKIIGQTIQKKHSKKYTLQPEYTGLLHVKLDNGQTCFISYNNFILASHWQTSDLGSITNKRQIPFIAYYQGDNLPINKYGEWVNIDNDELVLVVGKTNRKKAELSEYSLKALVYKKHQSGHEGIPCYFKPDSLKFHY